MLHAHQPVGTALGTGRFDEQIVDVTFAVGDVGQSGVRQSLGEFIDAALSIDPARAFLLFERAPGILVPTRTARLACEAVELEQAQRHALGGDGQGGMQVQPPTALEVQRTETGDALLGGEVPLGCVLKAQHPWVLAQSRFGAGDMRGK